MSIDLTTSEGYDVRKRIGRNSYNRKVGSKKSHQLKLKTFQPAKKGSVSENVLPSPANTMEQMPRNKKLNNKRKSRRATDGSGFECCEYKSQQMRDAEDKALRKLETKLNRQLEKQLRRTRRSTPKLSSKKPLSRKVILEEDFCLNNEDAGSLYDEYEEWTNEYYSEELQYEDEIYEDCAPAADEPEESTCQTYEDWLNEQPVESTCQTFSEWVISKTGGNKRVAYDETAEKDDWLNAENKSPASSMFGGCTTASVCLSGEEDEFLLLDDKSLLDVMNNQDSDADQKTLDAWELV